MLTIMGLWAERPEALRLNILPFIAEAIHRPRSRGQGRFFLSLLKERISHDTLLIILTAAGPFAFASEALAAWASHLLIVLTKYLAKAT